MREVVKVLSEDDRLNRLNNKKAGCLMKRDWHAKKQTLKLLCATILV